MAFSKWSLDPARHCGHAELQNCRAPPQVQPGLCHPTGALASETPWPVQCSWVGCCSLGHLWAETCTFLAGCRVASVAATLLNDHVLVVADHDLALLVVEHGEGAHLDGGAGRTRHLVGLVELQQTLWETREGQNMNKPLLRAGAGAVGGAGDAGAATPLT